MKVSVIIPTLDEATSLDAAVRSATEAGADEVIVVDGGSTDETIAVAEAKDAVELMLNLVRPLEGMAPPMPPVVQAQVSSGSRY